MNNKQQYESLMEIVAQARLLAAFADDDNVSQIANKIKELATMPVEHLGFSEPKFKSDSIVKYKELTKELNVTWKDARYTYTHVNKQ